MNPYPPLAFENAEDENGPLIPLSVRMKLDLAGYKLGLKAWRSFSDEQRRHILIADAESSLDVDDLQAFLENAVPSATEGLLKPLDAATLNARDNWMAPGPIPDIVARRLTPMGIEIDWRQLSRYQRFVLWVLAQRDDEHRFRTALMQFGTSQTFG